MSNNRYIELSELSKSIAHPDRLAIIQLMCNCDCQRMMVKSIYEKLKLEQPIVLWHLSIMRKSGLLKREQEENNTYYLPEQENQITNSLVKLFETIF